MSDKREGMPELPEPALRKESQLYDNAGYETSYADRDYYTAEQMYRFRDDGLSAFIATTPIRSDDSPVSFKYHDDRYQVEQMRARAAAYNSGYVAGLATIANHPSDAEPEEAP